MKSLILKHISKVLIGFGGLLVFTMGLSVYAQTYVQLNNGASNQTINIQSPCKAVSNSTGKGVFVPTKTVSEWSAFLGHLISGLTASPCYTYSWQTGAFGACTASCGGGTQTRSVWCQRDDGVTVANANCSGSAPADTQACNTQSCCVGNEGSACSPGNACGQTNTGTVQCDGSCSVGAPANPAGYGDACNSGANACGQTNAGTIQCDGSCSAAVPDNPAGYGDACTSSTNSCGMTNAGTIQCDGSCSATTPDEAYCGGGGGGGGGSGSGGGDGGGGLCPWYMIFGC